MDFSKNEKKEQVWKVEFKLTSIICLKWLVCYTAFNKIYPYKVIVTSSEPLKVTV